MIVPPTCRIHISMRELCAGVSRVRVREGTGKVQGRYREGPGKVQGRYRSLQGEGQGEGQG